MQEKAVFLSGSKVLESRKNQKNWDNIKMGQQQRQK